MSQNKHSASEPESGVILGTEGTAQLVAIVPSALKWAIKAIAARKQTTAKRLIVEILQDYVTREEAA